VCLAYATVQLWDMAFVVVKRHHQNVYGRIVA
jgi:hypothetical protein